MRIVTVTFSAPTDGRELIIDRDTVLANVNSPSQAALVSTDPNLKFTDLTSGAADGVDYSILSVGGDSQNELKKGDRIYICCTGQGALVLAFADVATGVIPSLDHP
jgi:hypothetical protein